MSENPVGRECADGRLELYKISTYWNAEPDFNKSLRRFQTDFIKLRVASRSARSCDFSASTEGNFCSSRRRWSTSSEIDLPYRFASVSRKCTSMERSCPLTVGRNPMFIIPKTV